MKTHRSLVKTLAPLGAVLTLTSVARADFNPVALTPNSYTFAIVVPSNGPAPLPFILTATTGSGTSLGDTSFFEQGFYNRPGLPEGNWGIPVHNTTFVASNNPNITFLMPPDYTTNNDLQVDSTHTSGTFTFVTPETETNLAILGTSGGGASTLNYTVTHSDNSTETGSISYPDWFNGTAFAWGASGRVTPGGGYENLPGSPSGNNNAPFLYCDNITVSGATPITSISFTFSSGGEPNLYAVSGINTGATTWTPIPVTGFSQVATVPAYFPVTATMDQGTNIAQNGNLATWYEEGYDTNAPLTGVPPSGSTFNSFSQPTHHYQMGNYSANNAILIDANHLQTNIVPASPAPYTAFAFLTAGGDVGTGHKMTNICIFQHADGIQETNEFFGYDWFENTVTNFIAYKANGRVNLSSRTVNNVNNGFPYLFETYFGLSDTASAVTNIILKFGTTPSGNATTYIMAVSATAGGVAPLILNNPQWLNTYAGSNAHFDVALAAGTTPVYTWQKGPSVSGPFTNLVDGGHVSGSGSTNLTLTGVDATDESYYQVVITNSVGVATSAPPVALYLLTSSQANITTTSDSIIEYFGYSSPAGQGPNNVIDRTTAEFIDQGADQGTSPFIGPVGVVLTPKVGGTVVSALRIYTSTDNPTNDPADITLEGSSDGGFTWTTLMPDTALSLPSTRNAAGLPINVTNMPLQEVDFANSTAYTSYRVTVTNVNNNATGTGMEVGEIEFLGFESGPPVIITNLQSFYQFFAGYPFQLSVPVAGTAPLTYGWYYNGSPLSNGGRISGVNSNVLTVANAQLSDAGSYQLFVTNSVATNSTSAAVVTISPVLGFNGPGGGWGVNGNGSYIGSNVLQVTDGNGGEASSSFFQDPVYVGGFEARWTYRSLNGPGGADGACFVIQNDGQGAAALGGGGGLLGYGGITNSAALEFNIYAGNGLGGVGITFATNGQILNVTAPGSVGIDSGDPIGVSLRYLSGTASLVLTDATAVTSFSASVPLNLTSAIGGTTGYVGFTGADGGVASVQQISDFTFVSLIPLTIKNVTATTAVISWPTGVSDYTLQSSPGIVTPIWSNVGTPVVVSGGFNTVTVPTTGAPLYYQLHLNYTPE